MELPISKLLETPLFDWIPAEGLTMLANCFDMEAQLLPAGQAQDSGGRIGYLLSGALCPAGAQSPQILPGTLLGVSLQANGDCLFEKTRLRALADSVIVWMDCDIMTSVCYRACWFHGRFVTQAKECLTRTAAQL